MSFRERTRLPFSEMPNPPSISAKERHKYERARDSSPAVEEPQKKMRKRSRELLLHSLAMNEPEDSDG